MKRPRGAFGPTLLRSLASLQRAPQLGVGIDLSAIDASSAGAGDYADYHNSDWVLSPSLVFEIGL